MTTTYSKWHRANAPVVPPMTDEVLNHLVGMAQKQGLEVFASSVYWYYRSDVLRDKTVWRLHVSLPHEDTPFTHLVSKVYNLHFSFVAPHPEPVIQLPHPEYTWIRSSEQSIYSIESCWMFVSEARAAVAAYAQQCAELLGGA